MVKRFMLKIDLSKCTKCGSCSKLCPTNAVSWKKKELASIDLEKCVKCRSCIVACRFNAID